MPTKNFQLQNAYNMHQGTWWQSFCEILSLGKPGFVILQCFLFLIIVEIVLECVLWFRQMPHLC